MTAQSSAVKPDVRIIIRRIEFESQALTGKVLRRLKRLSIPPFFGADPLGLAPVHRCRVKPLDMGTARHFHGPPAVGGWPSPLLAPRQLPIAIERQCLRDKWFRNFRRSTERKLRQERQRLPGGLV